MAEPMMGPNFVIDNTGDCFFIGCLGDLLWRYLYEGRSKLLDEQPSMVEFMRAKGIEPTPKIHAALHFYKIMYYLKTDKQDFKAVREAVVQLQEHFIPGMCFTKVISYLRILEAICNFISAKCYDTNLLTTLKNRGEICCRLYAKLKLHLELCIPASGKMSATSLKELLLMMKSDLLESLKMIITDVYLNHDDSVFYLPTSSEESTVPSGMVSDNRLMDTGSRSADELPDRTADMGNEPSNAEDRLGDGLGDSDAREEQSSELESIEAEQPRPKTVLTRRIKVTRERKDVRETESSDSDIVHQRKRRRQEIQDSDSDDSFKMVDVPSRKRILPDLAKNQSKQSGTSTSIRNKSGGFIGRKWTEKQVEALIRAVNKHGAGQWRSIKCSSHLFDNFSTIQLKDKWRNLLKVELIKQNSKGLWELDKSNF